MWKKDIIIKLDKQKMEIYELRSPVEDIFITLLS